ncbi:CaiB/BaiF CoA-transferase family protein [Cytophagales bacterium LB-30]|uniref:CaiB/BaiF CoA-transferase family protein n=2 Tax=Shiella aurantiaca TaxID=3058365 RepID=A0ABT8F959_9BACT|nr:CaiB/BaiF CoA-transferase family protein [Shiella aurantiaca]
MFVSLGLLQASRTKLVAAISKLDTFVIILFIVVQNIKILNGLKVLELASVLAGPSVGQFLAECGAEVIKVENPGTTGDVTRSWKLSTENPENSVSAYFSSVNWGKKSLALDITQAEGYKVLLQLVAWADVVLASYKPGDDIKLGVDYATLSAYKEGLVYGHITGYGRTNDKVGYDAIIQAESGFMYLNGEPNGASVKMPVALVDVLAGHQLKEGILLALLQKMQSGKGSYVEVSLYQAAISSLVNQATNWLQAGVEPQKMGSEHPNIVPYGRAFDTSDGGQVILAVGNDKQFAQLCRILGKEELAQVPEFATNAQRVKNREQVNAHLQALIATWPQEELLKQLDKAKIPAGGIQPISKALQREEAEPLLLHSDKKAGIRQFCAQLEGSSSDTSALLAPPDYGQQTQQILQEVLDFSLQQIEELKQKGILG